MGHSDGDHERDDLSADDSPWSDGVWSSEDDEVCVFFRPPVSLLTGCLVIGCEATSSSYT
jgi:hypothetical protein